ncbi:DUF805 domain-containing protein [Apilactobacillus kunkeei]|uniref:DUF805 domain-containing protein n=1 Tax=Apilactobacillus kunkeei TaxID=148814 RepID=UPI00110CB4EE|nr:DUF805 domain-containing protein [Apilactobacillus kunkeei]TMT01716.1 DUF805 domain-containing protein [Apilactobacillus kunkeei]
MSNKFCPNCGQKLDGNAEFCPNCGVKQIVDNNQQASALAEPKKGSNMITALNDRWNKMFTINAKSSRSEFWFGYLDCFIISMIVLIICAISGFNSFVLFVGSVVTSFIIIANLTAAIRRLHDANLSGHFLWLLLIPFVGSIVVLVLLCQSSKNSARFENGSVVDWISKWWSWLTIILVTLLYFAIIQAYVNEVRHINSEVSTVTNTRSDYSSDDDIDSNDDDSDDSSSSDKSNNGQDVFTEESVHNMDGFNIGPLKFDKVVTGVKAEKNISDDTAEGLFDVFGGAAPSSFFNEGGSYKQILITYRITNTSNQTIHLFGLMNNNDLLLPDGTQLNQLSADDFYAGESPHNEDIKPGAKINGKLWIQLKDDNKNDIPKGEYQFKTGEADSEHFDDVLGHAINFKFKI